MSEADSQLVTGLFSEVGEMYIADGHHRAASACSLARQVREARERVNLPISDEDDYNYFMSIIYPKSQLQILDYNRVLKDLNNHSPL
jgi:uncharacterized protein (DUF1015 family)